MITAEPAVVVPLETDEDIDGESIHDEESMCSEAQKDSTSAKTNAQQPTAITRLSSIQHQNQPGQMLRRLTKQTSLRRLTKQTSLRALTKQTSFRGNLDCDATVTSLQTKDLMSQQYSSPRFMHSPLHTMRRRVVKHDAPSLSIALEAIEQEGVLSGMPRSPIL